MELRKNFFKFLIKDISKILTKLVNMNRKTKRIKMLAQSAGAVEYTAYISAEV